MIIDIAKDINAILGVKYKIYVDNNAEEFIDIDTNETIDSQLSKLQSDKINCVMRAAPGEIVALKDLFSTSFNYALEFYPQIGSNINGDLRELIGALNGTLNDVGDYKYLINFNNPIPQGNVEFDNGYMHQMVILTGSIAISDKSIFANQIKVELNGVAIKGMIGYSVETTAVADSSPIANSSIPQITKSHLNTSFSLTIHARTDDTVIEDIINFAHGHDSKMYHSLRILNAGITANARMVTTTLTNAKLEAVIGGYVIISCTFERTEEL